MSQGMESLQVRAAAYCPRYEASPSAILEEIERQTGPMRRIYFDL
jgi:hypothetical protein